MSPPEIPSAYERPAEFCRALLAAVEASEGRRRRRKRDTTPDALGLELKRGLLQRIAADDPDPDALDGWLLTRCLEEPGPYGAGAMRAVAQEILEEWRLCHSVPAFGQWLARGAPSDDRSGAAP